MLQKCEKKKAPTGARDSSFHQGCALQDCPHTQTGRCRPEAPLLPSPSQPHHHGWIKSALSFYMQSKPSGCFVPLPLFCWRTDSQSSLSAAHSPPERMGPGH